MVQFESVKPTAIPAWPFPKNGMLDACQPALEGVTNCGSALCDAYTAIGTEWLSFLNRRLHVDLTLPAQLAKCSGPQDYFREWASLMKTAAEDYRNEFARLAEMNTTASQRAASALQINGTGKTVLKSSTWPGF